MSNLKNLFVSLLQDESGQDLIEYALVAGLIAVGAVTAMSTLSDTLSNSFGGLGSKLTSALPAATT